MGWRSEPACLGRGGVPVGPQLPLWAQARLPSERRGHEGYIHGLAPGSDDARGIAAKGVGINNDQGLTNLLNPVGGHAERVPSRFLIGEVRPVFGKGAKSLRRIADEK